MSTFVSVCYPELKANELLSCPGRGNKEITAVDDELGLKEDAFKVLFPYYFIFGRVHGGDRKMGVATSFCLSPIT